MTVLIVCVVVAVVLGVVWLAYWYGKLKSGVEGQAVAYLQTCRILGKVRRSWESADCSRERLAGVTSSIDEIFSMLNTKVNENDLLKATKILGYMKKAYNIGSTFVDEIHYLKSSDVEGIARVVKGKAPKYVIRLPAADSETACKVEAEMKKVGDMMAMDGMTAKVSMVQVNGAFVIALVMKADQ